MNGRVRFLIGMMYCGEQERHQALAAVERQSVTSWRLFTVENLPNKAAHDRLYGEFMANAGSCDFFLKLDADMVFRHEHGLQVIEDAFAGAPDVDGIMYDVHDWFSDCLIPGLTAFRATVRWAPNDDPLMVDPMPEMGKALRVSGPPAPLVVHCPDPAPLQAFRYGLHRALKMLQLDRPAAARDASRLNLHFAALNETWKTYREKGDRRRALAIAGAELALRGDFALPDGYSGDGATQVFRERFEALDETSLARYIGEAWEDEGANLARVQKLQAFDTA